MSNGKYAPRQHIPGYTGHVPQAQHTYGTPGAARAQTSRACPMIAAPLNPFDMGHQGRPCDAGITFGRASQSALTPIRSPTPFTYAYGDQARTRTVLPHIDCTAQPIAHQRCMYGPVAGNGHAWIATRAGLLGLSRQGECTARDRCRFADVLVRVACGLSFCHVSTPTDALRCAASH